MRVLVLGLMVSLSVQAGILLGQVPTAVESWSYTYKHYSDEDGLPQNSVKAITADHDGFVWFATESGLVRFDGQRFYTYDKSNTALSHTRFYSIQPDLSGVSGRFYAVAEFNEFVKIEDAKAEVDPDYYRKNFSSVPYMNFKSEKSFLAIGSPNYWFHLSNPEHYIIISPNGRGKFFVLGRELISFHSNFKKTAELEWKTGHMRNYFSQSGILYRYSDSGEIFRFSPQGASPVTLEGDILDDPVYDRNSRNFKFFWNNPMDQNFILLGNNFYYLEKEVNGSFRTKLILNDFSFESKDIRTVYYDSKRERVFLGSVTSGLYVFSKRQFHVLRIGNKDMDNIFYGQAVFDSNSVLTPTGTIVGLSAPDNKNKSNLYRDKRGVFKKQFEQDGRSMFRSVRGNIWLKAFDYLYKYDSEGRKIIGEWRAADQIKTIYEDVGNDRIWLGLSNEGLYYLKQGQKQLTSFGVTALPEIAYMARARQNKLWVATVGGLYLANIDAPSAVLIPGTKKMNIRSLFPVKSNPDILFFTTYEDGIFLYKDGRLLPFPLDGNGYLASAHCIVEDKRGFFWISTNNGLFQVAIADLLSFAKKRRPEPAVAMQRKAIPDLFYMYYSREDGFLTNEFNGGCQPCAVHIPNGAISMPSLNGLVWFWPDQLSPEVPSGPLLIDRVYHQGKRMQIVNSRVELPVNPKQVAVHLTVPFFGNRNNIHLAYALVRKGRTINESDWFSLSATDQVIRISDPDYGNYTLFVRKLNGFGVDNMTIVSIDLIIPPTWYESWWFKMIGILIAAAGIYAYILFRVRFLQKRNLELEARVERRTNRLQETLEALQASEKELNRQMHIQSRLIASISHDVRTPLRFIIASARRIEGFVRDNQYQMINTVSQNIAVSGLQMAQFLDSTMAYIKTQVYEKHIQMERIVLLPLIEEKVDFFANVLKEQNTQLINIVDPALTVKSNAQLLAIIIHNVLDNATKYTFEGTITISAEVRGDRLHLIISDTGPGIPETTIFWLHDGNVLESDESMTPVDQRYNSLGLLIVREISGMINTTVHIENHNGAEIHIIFQPESEE